MINFVCHSTHEIFMMKLEVKSRVHPMLFLLLLMFLEAQKARAEILKARKPKATARSEVINDLVDSTCVSMISNCDSQMT